MEGRACILSGLDKSKLKKISFLSEVRINHYFFIADQATVLFLKFPVDLLPSTLKTMDPELLC